MLILFISCVCILVFRFISDYLGVCNVCTFFSRGLGVEKMHIERSLFEPSPWNEPWTGKELCSTQAAKVREMENLWNAWAKQSGDAWEYPPKWPCSIIGKLVGGLEHFVFHIYILYIYIYIGNNNPSWQIFFRGVETTNQEKGDYSSALGIVTTMFRKTIRYSDDFSDRAWATPELATARWMWHLVDKWYRQAVWGAGSKSINFYAL